MIISKKGKHVVIEKPSQNNFRVTFVVDVEADTPKQAALKTEKILQRLNFRPSLQTIDPLGNVHEFDLADERI